MSHFFLVEAAWGEPGERRLLRPMERYWNLELKRSTCNVELWGGSCFCPFCYYCQKCQRHVNVFFWSSFQCALICTAQSCTFFPSDLRKWMGTWERRLIMEICDCGLDQSHIDSWPKGRLYIQITKTSVSRNQAKTQKHVRPRKRIYLNFTTKI